MELFTEKDSIVRQIWGKSDTILFIFAGSAAEFALNKAVDWLYFTGRLPADPLGRLFSTVAYARKIVFSGMESAEKVIDQMHAIHAGVEKNRASRIPEWAYRDVLFMLIHYSVVSFELLERKLSEAEKEEIFQVFYRVGSRMQLKGLPLTYQQWLPVREQHLAADLTRSSYTDDLFRQYKKHLGAIRYTILRQTQLLVVPRGVRKLLRLGRLPFLKPLIPLYRFSRKIKADMLIKSVLFPPHYKDRLLAMDQPPE